MAAEILQEDDYASSEDSDFAPEKVEAEGDSSPSDDEDAPATAGKPSSSKKRPADDGEAEDAGFENSGDEAVISRGKKRRKKKGRSEQEAAGGDDDEDGGEGGLIKTRSMRAQEKAERKFAASTGPVTIDVDALWAQMTGAAPAPPPPPPPSQGGDEPADTAAADAPPPDARAQGPADGTTAAAAADREPPEMIRIKRTYNFAGQVHSEEKLVPRDSAEARLYLASLGDDAAAAAAAAAAAVDDEDSSAAATKPPPRKAFRSAFEPVFASDAPRRADLDLGVGVRLQAREERKKQQEAAKKLNTVEKSRMDWAGFVDREGIQDELARAGKSKTSFAARQEFLARSEARREEEARRARLAGRV